MSFSSKILNWKLTYLASEWLGVSSKIYPELFPASPDAQLQEVTVSTFSIQLGQIRLITISDRVEENIFSVRSGIVPQLDRKNC